MNLKMEVNDIEKFFLNKDKKKSKKINTINPALLLEKTKESENKKVKKVNDKQQNQEPQSDLLRKTKEDEDWEDTCEPAMDLANLRIGMMPVKTEEVRPKVEIVNEEASGDEEDGEQVDKHAHPWGGRIPTNIVVESEVIESSQPQKYVVPSQRASGGIVLGSRAPKKAPNISNSTEFPSLREAVDIETEDSSWSRVTKNGHTQSSDKPTVNIKKESSAPTVTLPPSVAENKGQPSKYLPPHLRQNAPRPNDNKYNIFKESSN